MKNSTKIDGLTTFHSQDTIGKVKSKAMPYNTGMSLRDDVEEGGGESFQWEACELDIWCLVHLKGKGAQGKNVGAMANGEVSFKVN